MTQLQALLSQIDSETMLLPEFQRGYVWNRDQVRGLLRSLYLDYPVGSLLVWETQAMSGEVRGSEQASGNRTLLLDGQQRLTTLYGIARGRAPQFFEGDDRAFLGLRFNVEEEIFEFYAPAKMKGDPRWIDVTSLFQKGIKPLIAEFKSLDDQDKFALYISRLSQLENVMKREIHLEKIVGEDKTTDVVVDIFNRVNSGGTKLSKGDLALAKISAQSPELRTEMRKQIGTWKSNGFSFSLDWLLRNVNAVATGRSQFAHLDEISTKDFKLALESATGYVDTLLNLISGRLGLDHDRVFMGRFALPVLSLHLKQSDGKFQTKSEQDKALYWYVHSGLLGRYAGSTESTLAQDYEVLKKDGIDGLIQSLARSRGGKLTVSPTDFRVNTMGSRFYPMLYLLTRVSQAQDLCTGIVLRAQLLGKLSSLQVHHIFPKQVLQEAGYERGEINAVANFCFLTQESNLYISNRRPEDYFNEIHNELGHKNALASQWIPMDKELWKIENYRDFLAARRELLAQASNDFLDSLLVGQTEELALPKLPGVVDLELDDREMEIDRLIEFLADFGVVEPKRNIEIVHPRTNEILAIAEAYWPDGLQPGLGQPVILELDPEEADIDSLTALGIKIFESCHTLKQFVQDEAKLSAGESVS